MSDKILRSIDDAIEFLKVEMGEDLKERRFGYGLGATAGLSYNGIAPLFMYHEIHGCEFYIDGKYFGVLVVDIDTDYQMLDSASFLSIPTHRTGYSRFMGINILKERTHQKPDVSYGRVDNLKKTFLGVSSEADNVMSGLSAVFIPRYED